MGGKSIYVLFRSGHVNSCQKYPKTTVLEIDVKPVFKLTLCPPLRENLPSDLFFFLISRIQLSGIYFLERH